MDPLVSVPPDWSEASLAAYERTLEAVQSLLESSASTPRTSA